MIPRLFARHVACVISICLVASLTGCGGAYDSKVTGIVKLDETPLPRGTVAFHSVAGGPAAYAPINSDGTYVIRTGREEGLPAGDYQVTVTANEPAATRQTEKGGPPPAGKPIAPLWYRTKETSGLKYTVKPGSNEINLDLTTKAPAGWDARKQR